jgi:probable HAF family extracellular repeat protein
MGQIVGYYFDASDHPHGFLYDPNGGMFPPYFTLDDPSATEGTFALGINDAGQIVGFYKNASGYHGFLLSGSTYTTLDDPLAGPGGTFAYGILIRARSLGHTAVATTASS